MKPSNTLLAQLFLDAAELVHTRQEPYGCCAIGMSVKYNLSHAWGEDSDNCPACAAEVAMEASFEKYFRPSETTIYWWGEEITDASQDARVTALCLMAAMAEAGDLDESP